MNMHNPTKNTLRMIFIDFGLLRSPYCKISYLLADIKIRAKIWQPTYLQCAKIIAVMANVGNVFIKRLLTFLSFFSTFLRFLTFFFNFYLNVYYIYGMLYNKSKQVEFGH